MQGLPDLSPKILYGMTNELFWSRGVARLTRCPVKAETAGSNPVDSATYSLLIHQAVQSIRLQSQATPASFVLTHLAQQAILVGRFFNPMEWR